MGTAWKGLEWRDLGFVDLTLDMLWRSAHISSEKLPPLGKQRLSPRFVNQTPFQNPNFLFQRVLSVADLAYSLQRELISGWGIKKKYKIKQCNQLLQRVGNAINNNSIESCF